MFAAVLAVGLTVVAACSNDALGWRIYRQPPGPLHLSYRYPASWQVAGKTFVSTMGWVGQAELITGTDGSLSDLMAADCYRRGTVLGADGIFVTWGANLGSPVPIRLPQHRGQALLVNGHPARWSVQASTVCFKGRTIEGMIQEGPRTFLFMGADVGSAVTDGQINTLREIFLSARW